jgi:hypothetical protein
MTCPKNEILATSEQSPSSLSKKRCTLPTPHAHATPRRATHTRHTRVATPTTGGVRATWGVRVPRWWQTVGARVQGGGGRVGNAGARRWFPPTYLCTLVNRGRRRAMGLPDSSADVSRMVCVASNASASSKPRETWAAHTHGKQQQHKQHMQLGKALQSPASTRVHTRTHARATVYALRTLFAKIFRTVGFVPASKWYSHTRT